MNMFTTDSSMNVTQRKLNSVMSNQYVVNHFQKNK